MNDGGERSEAGEEGFLQSTDGHVAGDGNGKKYESCVSFLGFPVQTTINWVA